jgi:hypothetical protein
MPIPAHEEQARPRWPYALDRRRPHPDLSQLPTRDAELVRARLAKLDSACGCALGAGVALIALVLYVAIFAELLGGGTWTKIGVGAAVFVLGAVMGKTLGLMRARYARDRLIDEVHTRIADLPG